MASQKKKAKKAPAFYSCIVRVTGFDWHWGFSIETERLWRTGRTGGTLKLFGDVAQPEGVRYPQAEITVYGSLLDTNKEGVPPTSIGTIEAIKDQLHVYVWAPPESMAELSSFAATNMVRTLMFTATPLFRRKGQLLNIGLSNRSDPSDW